MNRRIFIGGIGTGTHTFVPFPIGLDDFIRHAIGGVGDLARNPYTRRYGNLWARIGDPLGPDGAAGARSGLEHADSPRGAFP